ncbi:MAG: hypothetical protein GX235_12380 [Clostridiales bacterium]|nr:hypothetical protein [Clostridiales bacterium]
MGNYPVLGNGSGRKVYDLGNDTVLKIAKNIKGYAQNEVESFISEIDESDTFAKVLCASGDNHYLIMEKAGFITNFAFVRSYYRVKSNRELFRLNNLSYIPHKYNLLVSDLCRPVNWGVRENRPVIIDYGFTGRIRRKYY